MTRRFFALLTVSVLSICLTLRAQPPAKSSKADAKPAEASPTKIVVDQDAGPSERPPHSVLTFHMKETGPAKAAEQRVIAFLRDNTGT